MLMRQLDKYIRIHVCAYIYTRIRVYLCAYHARILVNVFLSGTVMASQRTMSGQNWVLTGQILGLPDMLSSHLPTHSETF